MPSKPKKLRAVDDPTAECSPVTRQVYEMMRKRDLTEAELARRAEIGKGALNKAFSRGSAFTADILVAIAKGLDVTLDRLAGASGQNTGLPFRVLEQWVHSTPGVSKALSMDDELSVGDLLRYYQTPSKEGEHSGEAVLAQMRALRAKSLAAGGMAVTEEQAAQVLKMPSKRTAR